MTLMSILWAIAFGICPQRPSHSLYLGGVQMPIEARMAGIFAGFTLTAGYVVITGRGRAWQLPSMPLTTLLVGFVIGMGVDGMNALLYDLRLPHLYSPNLPLRLGTGLLTGLAMAAFVVPTFNDTVWRTGLNASPFSNWRDLAAAGGLLGLYFAAGLSGAALWLYPLSLLAILGVLLVLGMLGTATVSLLAWRANHALRLADLAPLALGGLLLAGMLLATTSGARYALFGADPLDFPLQSLSN